jgi:tetratricopeptide (TPR) repeat protein
MSLALPALFVGICIVVIAWIAISVLPKPATDSTKLLIFDFYGPDPQKYQLTETLFDKLSSTLSGDIQIIRPGIIITDSNRARQIGEEQKADMIVWGRYRDLTTLEVKAQFEILSSPSERRMISVTMPTGLQYAPLLQEPKSFSIQVSDDIREGAELRDISQTISYLSLFATGLIYYSQGNWAEASGMFEGSIVASSNLTSTTTTTTALDVSLIYYYLGNVYNAMGSHDKAIENYDESIRRNPNFVEAYYNRGFSYRCTCKFKEALDDFNKAIDLAPDYAEAYSARGIVQLYYAKDFDAARTDFQTAKDKDPKVAEAYWGLGYVAHYHDNSESHLEEAEAFYSTAIDLRPSDYYEAYYDRAKARSELEKYDEAIADFMRVIDIKSDYAEAYYRLGLTYRKRNNATDIDGAISSFLNAIRYDPNYIEAYEALSKAYKAKGQHDLAVKAENSIYSIRDEALKELDQTIKVDPNNAEAYYQRGKLLKDIGNKDEAVLSFEAAKEHDPDYEQAYYELGRLYSARGDNASLAKAVEYFQYAVKINDDYAEAHYDLGHAYRSLTRYDDAIKSFKKVISLQPDHADAYNELGITYIAIENYDEALSAIEVAISKRPGFSYAYFKRADAYMHRAKDGDKEKAIADLGSAINYKEGNMFAYYFMRAKAYKEIGNKNEAINDAKAALEAADSQGEKDDAQKLLQSLETR